MSNIYIVGSVFNTFSDRRSIFTAQEYIEQPTSPLETHVRIGQGLVQNEISILASRLSKAILNQTIPVKMEHTHKHHAKNVLIANFRAVNRYESAAELYLHGENDLISDHITGIHIPGIVLTESARQLMLATLTHHGMVASRFILTTSESHFSGYVFPVGCSLALSYQLVKDSAQEKRLIADITITQFNSVCAVIKIAATLVPEKIAAFNEKLFRLELSRFPTVGELR